MTCINTRCIGIKRMPSGGASSTRSKVQIETVVSVVSVRHLLYKINNLIINEHTPPPHPAPSPPYLQHQSRAHDNINDEEQEAAAIGCKRVSIHNYVAKASNQARGANMYCEIGLREFAHKAGNIRHFPSPAAAAAAAAYAVNTTLQHTSGQISVDLRQANAMFAGKCG